MPTWRAIALLVRTNMYTFKPDHLVAVVVAAAGVVSLLLGRISCILIGINVSRFTTPCL